MGLSNAGSTRSRRLYTDFRMNTFVYWPSGDRERKSHVFAEQVVTAVREALAGMATATA